MNTSRRVLMIAYWYLPCSAYPTAAARTAGLARYLPEFGWRPTVLVPHLGIDTCDCGACGHTEATFDGRDVDVRRQAVRPRNAYRIRRALVGSPSRPTSRDRRSQEISGNVPSTLERLLRPARALFETRTTWIPVVTTASRRLLEDQDFDAVWTTSGPYAHLAIGANLQRECGVPWVADLRDPVAVYGVNESQRTMADRIEIRRRRSHRPDLRQAAAIVEVTEPLAEQDAAWLEREVETVRSGFDPEDWVGMAPVRQSTDSFVILSSGAFYPGLVEPEPMLRGFAEFLADLDEDERRMACFVYMGRQFGWVAEVADRLGISTNVVDGGFAPPPDFRKKLREADVLALFANNSTLDGVPGGKLYEYIAAGPPIVAAPASDRWLGDLLETAGVGQMASDPATTARILLDHFQRWKHGRIGSHDIDAVADFSIRAGAGKLAAILDRVRA